MDEDTIIKCKKVFAKTMIKIYGARYLQAPNTKDTVRILEMSEARCWPRMLEVLFLWTRGGGISPVASDNQFTWHNYFGTNNFL